VVDRTATVATAGELWIRYLEGEDRDAVYVASCRSHLRDWIGPFMGNTKLANVTTVTVNAFRDHLLASHVARITAVRIFGSLKGLLVDAKRRGALASNPAEGVTIRIDKRTVRKLEIGVDIPSRDEIARVLAVAEGIARPFFMVVTFTGLRSSELRGLRWTDVDLEKNELHVRQRADRFNRMGPPKSAGSSRTVPFGPQVANALREWKLACPKGPLNLVFPNARGNLRNHGDIHKRIVRRTLDAAGVANLYGLHAFRHFFCSWCGARKVDGGRELPLLTVSRLMGHSSVTLTASVYSHLFPRQDDHAELAAAELGLISIPKEA
jgi:integrase